VIHSPPQVVGFAVDLHKDLVEMPLPVGTRSRLTDTVLTDFSCKQRSEPVSPKPHCFVTDLDPAFVQQVFYIPERERKLIVQHHGQSNDLGRLPEG